MKHSLKVRIRTLRERVWGYTDIDEENAVTKFSNRWELMYASGHVKSVALCIDIFFSEYNDEWPDAFEKLETWITENDAHLELTKSDA